MGLMEDEKSSNSLKAELNVILGIAILAKEMKSKKSNPSNIEKAKQLFEDSKDFSKPAEILTKIDLANWKQLDPDSLEMKSNYKELKQAILAAGNEELISKRDLKELFKMINPEVRKKEQIFKALKTAAAVLTLPIVWTLALAAALVALILATLYSCLTMHDHD